MPQPSVNDSHANRQFRGFISPLDEQATNKPRSRPSLITCYLGAALGFRKMPCFHHTESLNAAPAFKALRLM